MRSVDAAYVQRWSPGGAIKTVRLPNGSVRYFEGGTGQPLVLIHTLRTQLDYFQKLIPLLIDRFHVYTIDLLGHGHSEAPEAQYTADYFADSVAQFLDACHLNDVVLVGESVGASIGLILAARHDARVVRVVASNPYDYGRWGGIRRSSGLANVLFTLMLWPVLGRVVSNSDTTGILRRIVEGGLYDRANLPPGLVEEMRHCGSLPGHARAFRSLCLNWNSWIRARAEYPAIRTPVTLVYGAEDWSWPTDREANARVIPGARSLQLEKCGHFSSLEQPQRIAAIITQQDAART